MPCSSLHPAFVAAASERRATAPFRARCNPVLRDIIGSPAFMGALLLAATLPLSIGSASAASFTISNASTAAQTLAAGQTGMVTATGSLTNGAAVGIIISGNNATLTNLGTISQTGAGNKAIRDNTGVQNLVVNNGSSSNSSAQNALVKMQAADGDVIQMNKASASVTLNNWGSMISLNPSGGGSQALDFAAITSGANIVNNYLGGVMKANEADAVRPGVNGKVFNAGTILSATGTGSGSDGIDGQTNSGIQITNYATGLVDGGRHGITGGPSNATTTFVTTVSNSGTIQGNNGSGINLDGFNGRQSATITNSGSIIGKGVSGDGDGIDVDGLVTISNTGIIRSINAFNLPAAGVASSEGITAGGGTITNSGTIEGLVSAGNTNAVGRGITLAGNDIAGSLVGAREAIYGNATITNQAGGLIRGQSDSAIVAQGAASGFAVAIDNNAGATILGGGTVNAAILGGADNTNINNAGIINGASSGKAIELGSAVNTLLISGGSAAVIGSINGGSGAMNTMVVNPGAGNSFSYAGSISNFSSVEIQSGGVTLSGVNTYSGKTLVSGGILTLDGANRIAINSELVLNGGMLQLANAGGANGQSFASLSLMNNSAIDLGFSSITFNGLGTVAAGKTLAITDFNAATSGYAFRFLGDYSGSADFLVLMGETRIDGLAATYSVEGGYTNVTAVPEAQTWAMLLAGLGLVGAISRRRKQAPMA